MAIEFKLPDLGEGIESGDIVSVLVNEGDQIEANQPVLEVETGKATVELPAPHAGRVAKIHVAPGQSVTVGGLLMSIEAESGAAAAGEKKKGSPAKAKPQKPAAASKPPADDPSAEAETAAEPDEEPAEARPSKTRSRPAAKASREADKPSPAASTNGGPDRDGGPEPSEPQGVAAPAGPSTRRLARELGVDLTRLTGTGPHGRITEDDVKKAVRQTAAAVPASLKKQTLPNAVAGQDAWGAIQMQPLTRIRRTIAANMARSASTIPHVTNFDDADITELERIRKGGMADYVSSDVKLTMLAFVTKAVAHALKLHPVINASLDLDNGQVVYKDYVSIGVAVDTPRGLVVPVMRQVDRLTIPQIAEMLSDMAERARDNKFGVEEMRGGTFTISNLGAIGGTYSTPIINHPEVAILLLGRSRQLPVVINEHVQPRLLMPLSLSYDHRLVDGAAAARFLNEVKTFLQVPGRLLLAT